MVRRNQKWVSSGDLVAMVEHGISSDNLIQANATIVVGFSGGADSRALLHVLHLLAQKNNWSLIVAHLDHEWRETSASEAARCEQIAHEYGLPFVTSRYSAYCATHPELAAQIASISSPEAAARKVRRHFFVTVATAHEAHYIALAHHRNDQVETFFIRLIRGAGVEGLGCMHASTPISKAKHLRIVRPFLRDVTRTQIMAFVQSQKLDWVDDPSNRDPRYLRSRIRHNLLPVLATCDVRAFGNIEKTVTHMQQIQEYVTQQRERLFSALCHKDINGLMWLSIPGLLEQAPFMQKTIVLTWLCKSGVCFEPSERLFDEIIRFFSTRHTGSHRLYQRWKIICTCNQAAITLIDEPDPLTAHKRTDT